MKNKGTFQRCYSKSIKANNYSYGIEKDNYENIVGESRHVSGHSVSYSNYVHIHLFAPFWEWCGTTQPKNAGAKSQILQ